MDKSLLDLRKEIEEGIPVFVNALEQNRNFIDIINNTFSNYDAISENYEKIISMNSLVLIAVIDLSISTKYLIKPYSNIESKFFIKNIYLIIYETLKTYQKHQEKLKNLSFLLKIENEFILLNKNIKNFKKTYKFDSKLKQIRNNVSGHISSDFKEFYDSLIKLDVASTIALSTSFMLVLQDFSSHILNIKKIFLSEINKHPL